MRTWFTGLYLMAVSSKGLSSVARAKPLGIGQKDTGRSPPNGAQARQRNGPARK
jgi:hypothetical protein